MRVEKRLSGDEIAIAVSEYVARTYGPLDDGTNIDVTLDYDERGADSFFSASCTWESGK